MKYLKIIVTIIFFYSCNSNPKTETSIAGDSSHNKHVLSPTFKSILPNKKLDSIIEAFVKENPCDSCIHEIYIDKAPLKLIITLRARMYSTEYLQGKNPLFLIKYNDMPFYIYSGIEDVFIGDKKLMPFSGKEKDSIFINWNITFTNWEPINNDATQYKIEKKVDVIPFFPATPPNIKIRKNSK